MNWQPDKENQEKRFSWRVLFLLLSLLGLLCLAGMLFGQSFFSSRSPEFIPVNLHSLLAADYSANPNPPRIPGLRFGIIWDTILDRDPAANLEARKAALLKSLQTPVAVVDRPVCQGVHIIYAEQDTWVDSAAPTATHGRDPELQVGRDQDQVKRIFLYFSLDDSIPQGSFIASARLEMDLEATTGPATPGQVRFSSPAEPFSELTTSWSNQPELLFTYRTVKPLIPSGHAWDVTDLVRDWLLDYYQNVGLAAEPEATGSFTLVYYSREADSQTSREVASSTRLGPRLIIDCGAPSPTPEGVAAASTPTPVPPPVGSSPTPPQPLAPTGTPPPTPSPALAAPTVTPPATVRPPLPTLTPVPAEATTTPPPVFPSPTPTSDNTEEGGSTPPPETTPTSPTSTPTPIPRANLGITKTDSSDPAVAGTNLTYILNVVNNGPSPATGVTVVDTLPPGVTLVSATPSQGNCTGATCNLGSLANGGAATVTVVVTVDSATTGSLSNSAGVSATEADPDTGDNTTTETTAINTSADLTITKTDSFDPVVSGGDLTYTLTVTNTGPSDATGITLSDSLPAEVTYSSASSICAESGGTINCSLGDLTAGSSGQVTITVTVDPAVTDGTVISNTATASGAQTDPNPGSNSVTEPTTIDEVADLAISKSDDPDPVVAGETLTYTLTITNNGPSVATSVVVTDILPAGASFSSASPGCSEIGGTATCTLASLAVSASTQFEINVDVNPDATGPLTNYAEVASATADTNSSNNSTSENTMVNAETDLAIGKSDNPDPVVAGETLTYTLTITNNGPSTAAVVTTTDTLPAGVSLVSAIPSQGSCTGPACTLGAMADGDVATVEIVVTVNSDTTGSLSNSASVVTSETDPNLANNSATETTTVNTSADLAISKLDDPDPVAQGQALTYTLTILNNGPSAAAGLVVTDTLPGDFIFGTASPGCAESGGVVSCSLASLAVSATAQFTIAGTVSPLGLSNILTNVAEVDGTTADPATANNTTTITTTITSVADLSVTKTVDNATPYLGGTITFTVTANNAGPNSATNVSLTDLLPAAFGYVSDSPSQGTYNAGAGVWTIGTLNSAQTVNLTLVATATTSGVATNTAQISASDQPDPDSTPGNNLESEDDQDSAGVTTQLPALSINDVTVTEGDSGTITATFSVTLSTAIGVEVSVNYGTSDNTATAPADYQTASGLLTFPAGTTVQTFTVQIQGDTLDEIDETYTATLTGPVNATIADGTGIGTIIDDDNPSFVINDVTVVEGNSGAVSAVFTVTLSAAGVETATVNYGTADGTATAGSDYNTAGGLLTFPPGVTEQTVTVDVVGDTTIEPNESFYVNLSSPSQATIADGQGEGTILDDDSPLATLTLTDVWDSWIEANNPGNQNNGQDSMLIRPPMPPDQEYRSLVEFYTLESQVPAGSTVLTATLHLYQDGVRAGQTIFIYRLTRNWEEDAVRWNRAAAGGGGLWTTDGGDYDLYVWASFSPDVDTDRYIDITDLVQTWVDGTYDNHGMLLTSTSTGLDTGDVKFYTREHATVAYRPSLVVTYTTTAAPSLPTLSISDTTVLEGNSGTTTAVFTVTLSSVSTQTVTVDYATADNTATTADNDYVGASNTLSFTPGDTQETFSVTINGDLKHEGDETFFVYLSAPTNADIADGQGIGTILNDEIGGFALLPGDDDRRIFLPVIIKP